MVGFGKSLVVAGRRECWKEAYLDYQGLKDIVGEIEQCLSQQHRRSAQFDFSVPQAISDAPNESNEDDPVRDLKERFFRELKLEIEKLSLFTLQQQGKLADAVGALRFETKSSATQHLFQARDLLQSDLLQSDTDGKSDGNTRLDQYAFLGVQLLHLLKFVCINSIGIRKILKKYNKVFSKFDEAHHYYVAGDHLQQLAFSPSIRAIESSLQSTLAECYKQQHARRGVGTTTDELLLVNRFHCVMACCQTLRRNAEILQRPFWDFLSRQSMILTGSNLGEMGDSGKKALKWLFRLRPDQLLSMSGDELYQLWRAWSGGPTAVKTTNEHYMYHQHHRQPTISKETAETGRIPLDTILEADMEEEGSVKGVLQVVDGKTWLWGGVNAASMTLNLLSTLLYTVNYYIVAPTANHYAIKLGADGAYGSTLIGASSFSAIFAAFFYSMWYTKSSFKSALAFSALCPLIGNLIYALAISYRSMPMAIGGRILGGFGSAEVVNRQLISACVDFEGMTQASALFVAAGAIGMSVGPLLAGILEMTTGRDMNVDVDFPFMPAGGIIYNHVTSPGFVMSGLWFCQLLALLTLFEEPKRINSAASDNSADSRTGSLALPESGDEMSDEEEPRPVDSNGYGAIPPVQGMQKVEANSYTFLDEAAITVALIFQNPGLPVTVLLFGFVELADEVLISSCSMVVRRYFGWNGYLAGFLIASLGALVLPAHFVVERASHYYSERKILSRSLLFLLISTLGILNWSGMFYDVAGLIAGGEEELYSRIESLLTNKGEFPYDYGSGPAIYIVFLSAIFMGTIVLEGVDTSIMAKVTPAELNDRFINCGLLATLVGTLGRVLSDGMITMSALLDIHVFVDFVNATFIPVLLLTLAGLYMVKKCYKSLV